MNFLFSETQKKLIESSNKSAHDKLEEFIKDIEETKTGSSRGGSESSSLLDNKSSKSKKVKLTKESIDPMDPSSYSDVPR